MGERREWFSGVLESEFWTIHKGWRVIVRKSPFGWHWSIMRDGAGVGSVENDRPAAEATAFAEVDRRERATVTLQDIHPTSETWTRHTAGMQWFAAYRVDLHNGQHVAVLSRWTDAIADPRQTMLKPQPTREQAVWAVEQFLFSLDYQRGAL